MSLFSAHVQSGVIIKVGVGSEISPEMQEFEDSDNLLPRES
jgi:hypothetical protein